MLRLAFVLLLCVLPLSSALAEKRVALLIGNQNYTSEIGRLTNPHNDIALLESALKRLGFEVTTVRDAGLAALHQAVNGYVRRVRAAGVDAIGFFYYGGHGAADAGTNYLIPVDVISAEEGELWDRSLRLTEITRKLKVEAGNATHFVVFDACRNNLKLRKAGSRALVQSRGFVPAVQESGMLIAYATAEGELASDVGTGAGPYASVLADEVVKPGVEAVTMFRNVQRRVRATVKQEPYLGFNALGDVYLAGLAPDAAKPEVVPPPAPPSEADRAWDVVKNTASIPSLEAFIRRFGDTFYGDLARMRLAELKQAEADARNAAEEARAKAEAMPAPTAKIPKAERPKTMPNVTFARPNLTLPNVTMGKATKEKMPKAAIPPTALRPHCDEGVETMVGQERKCLKPRDTFKDCPECPEMVVVPVGSFMMGSPAGEEGRKRDSEGPVHNVTILRPFAVGKFEVTFAEFDACVDAWGCKHTPNDLHTGYPFDGGPRRGSRPVIDVSWHDAKEYVAWASGKTGKSYRLLSEAEWEYAARAGTTTRYAFGDKITRSQVQSTEPLDIRSNLAQVGSFLPNKFGVHDMHGNVGEWCEENWFPNYQGAPNDGSVRLGGDPSRRVLRGGSWRDGNFETLRSAARGSSEPDRRHNDIGFRVARTLQ